MLGPALVSLETIFSLERTAGGRARA